MKRALQVMGLAWLLLICGSVQAEQFERVGNYQIHYSAVNTRFLAPEVAAAYDIPRSKVIALLSVSVLEEQPDGSTEPVPAVVNGRVANLTGQSQPLAFRTVREGDSIYQLATFRILPDEPLRFTLDVRYDRNAEPAEVAFMQRFYID
ncbi:protein of unknown function [Modicisalibacter muralis]|uniref:DUF4426 domain-containing protein n=1 Tax=Modicisalibacter muralis TaxID=119000 RepID=A0A1G9NEB8_9GAMM|nr:DUF4426 domain-containing protein [Halomonas muralis]SDL84822.1 protein of unknown function [Halomonas muralis]